MSITPAADEPVIVVTGAGSGMGRAVALLMSRRHDRRPLVLCDLRQESLEETSAMSGAAGRTTLLAGDVAAPDFGERLVRALADRKIGALVHCAGLSGSMGDAGRILDVNLSATMRLVEVARPRMARGSAAVLFSSMAANFLGAVLDGPINAVTSPETVVDLLPFSATGPEAAYAISKRGVQLLARRAASAFGEYGARINSLSPGVTDTPMGRAEMVRHPMMHDLIKNSPLRRAAQAEEVATVAAFLCSDESSFITGTDILVDGGCVAVTPSAEPAKATS